MVRRPTFLIRPNWRRRQRKRLTRNTATSSKKRGRSARQRPRRLNSACCKARGTVYPAQPKQSKQLKPLSIWPSTILGAGDAVQVAIAGGEVVECRKDFQVMAVTGQQDRVKIDAAVDRFLEGCAGRVRAHRRCTLQRPRRRAPIRGAIASCQHRLKTDTVFALSPIPGSAIQSE